MNETKSSFELKVNVITKSSFELKVSGECNVIKSRWTNSAAELSRAQILTDACVKPVAWCCRSMCGRLQSGMALSAWRSAGVEASTALFL